MKKTSECDWWLDVFLWVVIAVVILAYACKAEGQEAIGKTYLITELPCRPGVLFVTRNHPTVGNPSPGYWNHTAVMGPNGWVIEAQAEPGKVIAVPFWVFYYRYPEIQAFRVCPNRENEISNAAIRHLGEPYKKLKNNCVTVARVSVKEATRLRPGWRRPDQVLSWSREVLCHKIDYRNWRKLSDPYAGMTTDKGRVRDE